MVRKAVRMLLVLALVFAGFSPVGAPSAITIATAMDLQQPCCTDCDQPAMPDDSGCRAMGQCATASPLTILAANPVTIFFTVRLVLKPADQSPASSLDGVAPFRPPRSSILA